MFKIKGAILMTEIDDGEGKRMPDYIYIHEDVKGL